MKIGMKLTFGFSLTVIAMALTVAFCLNTGEKMHEEFEALKDDIIPGAIAMADMAHYADKIHLCIMEHIVAGEYGQKEIQSTMQLLEKAGTEHLEHEKHISLEEKNAAEGLLARIKRVNSAAMEIINSKDQGRSIAELTSKEDQEFHPAMVALLKQLNEHKATHMAELAAAKETVHHAHISGKRITLLVSAIVTFLAAVIAFTTTRSITKPLVALHKGTEIIGSGKLDYQVATDAKDEIGQLSRAFDQMTGNLKKTTASRDELDAANQQLQAHEQQLKASNQQLDASNQQLESEITERKQAEEEKGKIIAEMERMNRLMTGREMRVIEMKKEVNSLLAELGREPEYKSVLEETEAIVSSDKAG